MGYKPRLNKEISTPKIKIPIIGGLIGQLKANISFSHGIESITWGQKAGPIGNSVNYNLHSGRLKGRMSAKGTGLSQDYGIKKPDKK